MLLLLRVEGTLGTRGHGHFQVGLYIPAFLSVHQGPQRSLANGRRCVWQGGSWDGHNTHLCRESHQDYCLSWIMLWFSRNIFHCTKTTDVLVLFVTAAAECNPDTNPDSSLPCRGGRGSQWWSRYISGIRKGILFHDACGWGWGEGRT